MRAIVIGYGIQGKKREKLCAPFECVRTVDSVNPAANCKSLSEVPVDSYDAAFVCTPDEAKFELLNQLLAAGKHVLVEKPLLLNENEFNILESRCKKSGAICYTAYNHRFEPHLASAKEILDQGVIGEVYSLKMFYGNGTAADVKASPWRDKGEGVLPDLGSHVLDLADFLVGSRCDRSTLNFKMFQRQCHENSAPDRVVFGTEDAKLSLLFELTLLSWRNSFYLDVLGSRGSLHVDCLCKWGPSILKVRTRKLPSGRPEEEVVEIEMSDPTWERESQYFYELIQSGQGSSFERDRWIASSLNSLSSGVKP